MASAQVNHCQSRAVEDTPDNSYLAHLEEYIQGQLLELGQEAGNQANLPDLVERASAAINGLLLADVGREPWLYLRVPLPEVHVDRFVAARLAPFLLQISGSQPIQGWWWLFKQDTCGSAVRLRIRPKEGSSLDENLIVRTCSERFESNVTVLRYEPELRLFGGVSGMRLAHEQFVHESEFLARWTIENGPRFPLVPHGLSLALVLKLLRACGLDSFECWDVLDRVCDKRLALDRHQHLIGNFREFARRILHSGPETVVSLYAGENSRLLQRYCGFVDVFGKALNRCFYQGELACGLREFLVPIILFHWNRTGMSGLEQVALAHSTTAELAEMNRQGSSRAAATTR